jgi:hypothetical protein
VVEIEENDTAIVEVTGIGKVELRAADLEQVSLVIDELDCFKYLAEPGPWIENGGGDRDRSSEGQLAGRGSADRVSAFHNKLSIPALP